MARFNLRRVRPSGTSPVRTRHAATRTHEGGAGYLRDARSELFLLAVTNLVTQDTVYEPAATRDDRFTDLVRRLAVTDPRWTADLLAWLRGPGRLRTAALVGAAEYAGARLAAGEHGGSRQVIDSVLQRADEPGELLAYWMTRYGRAVPKPVKRGLADAARRLYTERAVVRYDTPGRAFRFGDVLELTHPAPHPERPWQGPLFRHVLDRRHGRGGEPPGELRIIREWTRLQALPAAERHAALVTGRAVPERAGMSWEAVASWLRGPLDAAAWQAVIPSMGYMALLRNLRNLDRAGVDERTADAVARRLADPTEVARAGQFPFRYLAAHRATDSLRWAPALEQALDHSLAAVPALPGRTLVLVDRSDSMFGSLSAATELNRADTAALFGTALAARAHAADLVEYGARSRTVRLRPGAAVLRTVERFGRLGTTHTTGAVRRHYRGHDRVVIVTDEQAHRDSRGTPGDQLPAHIPLYTWNLAGYQPGHGPSGGGNRHTFGGLTDHAFRLVALLEAGRNADWPWAR